VEPTVKVQHGSVLVRCYLSSFEDPGSSLAVSTEPHCEFPFNHIFPSSGRSNARNSTTTLAQRHVHHQLSQPTGSQHRELSLAIGTVTARHWLADTHRALQSRPCLGQTSQSSGTRFWLRPPTSFRELPSAWRSKQDRSQPVSQPFSR
jgi:hypothetical protein